MYENKEPASAQCIVYTLFTRRWTSAGVTLSQLQNQHRVEVVMYFLVIPIFFCENYLPLPNSHLCEIHMCTCINCSGDILSNAWLKIANHNDMDVMFFRIFNLCDVRMRIAITCIVPRGFLVFLLEKSIWG